MKRYKNNDNSNNFKKVICSQCGEEITKRSSKCVGDQPYYSGKPLSECSQRVCKEGLNNYPDGCKRKKK